MDGAFLVTVESLAEDMFIKEYLSHNDIEQRRWYTSGQDIGGRWTWTSTGAIFSYELGFLTFDPNDQGSNLVYAYKCMNPILNRVSLFVINILFNLYSWCLGLDQRFGNGVETVHL